MFSTTISPPKDKTVVKKETENNKTAKKIESSHFSKPLETQNQDTSIRYFDYNCESCGTVISVIKADFSTCTKLGCQSTRFSKPAVFDQPCFIPSRYG